MKKFIVENEFWDLFPESSIGIIICKGIDNTIKSQDVFVELLSKSELRAKDYLTEEEFSNNKIIKVWRDSYKKFKTKKGARSSIEALMKRISNGNTIGTINPLVDIYNSISLSYGFPSGGEDLDKINGNIRLAKALGNEEFVMLGSDEVTFPYEGEIVYKDDTGTICRCFNWRESSRTMLTENTKNAFMCMESVDESRKDSFEEALTGLKNAIEKYLGGECTIHVLNKFRREVELIKEEIY